MNTVFNPYFLVLSLLTGLLLVFGLDLPAFEWDESRNGINALEMLASGDYLNLRYAGDYDTWNAKPPLFIWFQAASISLLGKSVLALRLPTYCFVCVFVLYLFAELRRLTSDRQAFFAILVLLSISGFIGPHVALTGDFDVLFTLMSTAAFISVFRYAQALTFRNAIIMAAFFGLAFLTKGFAVLLPLGCAFIFLLLFYRKALFSRYSVLAACMFSVFPIAWYSIVHFFGAKAINDAGETSSSVSFWHDIIERFTNTGAANTGDKLAAHYVYIFEYLDTRVDYYYILVYLGILLFGYFVFRKRISKKWLHDRPILLLSLSVVLPVSVFACLGHNINYWYLTPMLPFLAILVSYVMEFIWQQNRIFKIGLVLFIVFNLVNRLYEMRKLNHELPQLIQEIDDRYIFMSSLNVQAHLPQDELLYLYLRADTISFDPTLNTQYKVLPKLEQQDGQAVYAEGSSTFLTD